MSTKGPILHAKVTLRKHFYFRHPAINIGPKKTLSIRGQGKGKKKPSSSKCADQPMNVHVATGLLVHGPESENLPPLGNFRDPPSFLPEGVLYSFPGVVKHINAANMQKYNFLYKPHAKFSHFRLQ